MSTPRNIRLRIDACGLLLCAAITAGGYAVGVAPLLQAHRAETQVRETLAQLQREGDDHERSVAASRERLVRLDARLAEVGVTLQPAEKLNERLSILTTLADKLQLRIDALEPGSPQLGSRHTAVPIRITGTGTFVSCVEYLGRLHAGVRDVGVTSLRLASQSPASPTASPPSTAPAASFQFELKWYAAPDGYAAVPEAGRP